jgi:hypothetical protein
VNVIPFVLYFVLLVATSNMCIGGTGGPGAPLSLPQIGFREFTQAMVGITPSAPLKSTQCTCLSYVILKLSLMNIDGQFT